MHIDRLMRRGLEDRPRPRVRTVPDGRQLQGRRRPEALTNPLAGERNDHDRRPTTDASAAPVSGGIVPYLSPSNAGEAADFYLKAFGAQDLYRIPPDEQGRTMHIHLVINGNSLMLSDFYPEHGYPPEKPGAFTLHLQVDDVDAWFERAVAGRLPGDPAGAADVLGRPLRPGEGSLWLLVVDRHDAQGLMLERTGPA
jgi:PhnB protein